MIEVIHGDCLEVMKGMEDNSIDLVLTDPPYLIDDCGGGGTFGSKNRKYHREMEENTKAFKEGVQYNIRQECIRIMNKVHMYIFCNKNLLLDTWKVFESYNCDLLTYHKTNPTPTCNNKYLSDTEYILYVREKGVKLYGSYDTKKKYFIQENGANPRDHPTVKPINIVHTLINNSYEEGMKILDPFAGSGTTGVACKELGRDCILIEKEKKYIDIINKRIENTTVSLFH